MTRNGGREDSERRILSPPRSFRPTSAQKGVIEASHAGVDAWLSTIYAKRKAAHREITVGKANSILTGNRSYEEKCICPTAVCASNFCPFLHKIFSRTSGLNSILTASKSFIQRCGVMKG